MEGPLVSDTTEFLSGAADASGETPLGRPAPAGNADSEGSRTGSSAPAGPDGAAAARGRRRQGTGLSALLLPELQQVAQQMGIPGTARMRKSQLIAAIQEKQGGTADRGSRPGPDAAATEVSAPRAASAGADVSRPVKQDAMEPQTSPETGSRRNGRAGGNGGRVPAAATPQFSSSASTRPPPVRPRTAHRPPMASRARRPLPLIARPIPSAVTASRAPTGRAVTAAAAATTPVTPATASRPAAVATTAGTTAVVTAATVVSAGTAVTPATAGTAVTAVSRPPRSPVATSTTTTAPAAAAAATGSVTATGAASAARAASPSRWSAKTTC